MIGRLCGKINFKNPQWVLIDVNGVGYEVHLPLSTLATLPPIGEEVALWIYTKVREDELRLFGFASLRDRDAFTTMLKVSGVGPKVAIAVIGALSGDQLAKAISEGNTKRLTAIPGIGKKTAERIILELGGKLALGDDSTQSHGPPVFLELCSALVNLGFKQAKVDMVVSALKKEGETDRPFEELLRQGLSMLQKKS